MSGPASRPFFNRSERRAVARFVEKAAGVAALAASLSMLIALLSYSPHDPGVYSATGRLPTNWLGWPGSMIADLMIRTLGYASYAAALYGAMWGARWVVGSTRPISGVRLLAAPLAVIALAAFASAHPLSTSTGGGLGGLIGDFLFGALAVGLPVYGEKLRVLLTTLICAGAALGLSLIAIGATVAGLTRFFRYTRAQIFNAFFDIGDATTHLAAGDKLRRLAEPLQDFAMAATGLGGGSRLEPAIAGGPAVERTYVGDTKTPASPSQSNARNAAPRKPTSGMFNWRTLLGELSQPIATVARVKRRAEPPLAAPPAAPRSDSPIEAPPHAPTAPASAEPKVNEDAPKAPTDMLMDILKEFEGPSATPEENAPASSVHSDPEPSLPLAPQKEDSPPTPKAPLRNRRPNAKDLTPKPLEDPAELPSLDLLSTPREEDRLQLTEHALATQADRLQAVLQDYGVRGDIIDVHPGPVITLFELEPAPGLKASRVVGLADDIARSMSAVSARVSTVPGRNIIGIELPNQRRETVRLRELLDHPSFARSEHPLTLALGKDISGAPVVANLARMPHLLIAGTTGSGKSVGVNTMLMSLLYRLPPEEVRLILIDPKMLELSVYNQIPHLIAPVVTDPKKAVLALKWAVREMEARYQKMARLNVRGLDAYNEKVREAKTSGESFERVVTVGFDEATGEPVYETQYFDPEPMPRIVIVVDELADLMMVAGKEIEHCIQRLAQMARASGIHLIMATQRPSVDVITGTIKANFPIRISFQVTSKVDSRTILGEQGAEQLLGRGDMLYRSGGARLTRIHGAFVSDEEVSDVVQHLRKLGGPNYTVDFEQVENEAGVEEIAGLGGGGDDALYDRAVAIVASERKASTSFVQRRLQIGYNRAARIIEMMEEQGVVSPANHVGKREVLIGQAD
ncbi:MAG: DNA translocase FtsK 4TM domain-containing protein [Rhodobacteraceae bacterium]|nr:DNA translocase FtsK 4TM domain-containing protein [Paracoccaceae bacterium]